MISVAPVCSAIEGIALVTIFVSLYLWLFRAELRFPHALLLYPLGIAASACLNVVRIGALLILGIEGQPDLAVGGFHSHAGWVMFTAVALGIIAVARRVTWFNRAPAAAVAPAPLPPLRRDPVAAHILPFAVFMLTAIVAPAISPNPAMFYPIRVILLAAALALVWPALRGIAWRISPLAWKVGAAIGVMWVASPVAPSDAAAPYGALTGGMVALWFLLCGVGTVVLVPLVEELFFRDYLESQLRGPGPDAGAPVADGRGDAGHRRAIRGASRPLGRGFRGGLGLFAAGPPQRPYRRCRRRPCPGQPDRLCRGRSHGRPSDHLIETCPCSFYLAR